MAKPNIYRCFCDGEFVGDGTSQEWADTLFVDRNYVTRMTRYGMPIHNNGKAYTFEIVGIYDNFVPVYFGEPIQPKPAKPKKPKKKKVLSVAQVERLGRKNNRSYGYQVAYMEGANQ